MSARVPKGILSVVVLAALLVGVPWFLVATVGNPWPGRDAIDLRDEQAILLGVLAIAAWIVWARFLVAVVQEFTVQGRARRDRPRHRPVAGSSVPPVTVPGSPPGGGFGAIAQRLVAAVFALVPLAPMPVGGPSPLPSRPASLAAAASSLPRPDVPVRPAVVHSSALPEVQVRENDSLFRIAERHLGDRTRWREILELNAGRAQPDGGRLTTPSSLRAGWILQLPAGAAAESAVAGAAPNAPAIDSAAGTHLVEPGDSYWEIAEEHLEVTFGRPASDAEVLVATHALLDLNAPLFGYDDPAMIHPGDEVILPPELAWAPPLSPPAPVTTADTSMPSADSDSTVIPSTAPPPDTPAVSPGATVETAPPPSATPEIAILPSPVPVTAAGGAGPSRGEALPAPVPTTVPELDAELLGTAAPGSRNHAVPLGLGAAVLVGGGALALVDARRRAALRRASAQARLVAVLPSGSTEMTLRALGATDRLVRLDVVLRALAGALRDQAAQPDLVRVHLDGTVDVRLGSAVVLPAPWRPLDAGWFRLPGGVTLDDLLPVARTAGLPCPALVHLGTSEGAELYIDVEAVGALHVDASLPDTAAILDAIGLGLAVSPFAIGASLAMVGLPPRLADARPDLDADLDVERAAEMARAAAGTIRAATCAGATTFALRARTTLERWEPAIIVLGAATEAPDELKALAESPAAGVALVTASGYLAPPAAHLHRDGPCWVLDPYGLPIEPIGIEPADVDAVMQLVEDAEREHLAGPAPFDQDVAAQADIAVFEEREWEVLVRVLGGVRVHDGAGIDVRFERGKAQELVCWLAVHRHRATRGGARAALWETDVRDATFANVVSDARRSLGRHQVCPHGQEWIGRTLSESLPLHPLVVTDAELLRARVDAARCLTPEAAIEVIRPGLALVSDLPFAGTGYLWPDAEGTVTELILLATGAAVDMAQRCLELDDVEGVFWATGQGLRVLPGHEDLVALRMQAHARQGDLAAVRAEWGSYERALAADPWSDAEPAPKLVELRRELLGPATART